MDGAQAYYRDHGAPHKGDLVEGRPAWAEAGG